MGSGTFIHRLPILKAHGAALAHFVLGGEDQARSHPPRFGWEYLLTLPIRRTSLPSRDTQFFYPPYIRFLSLVAIPLTPLI